jgi:hypothetical protein
VRARGCATGSGATRSRYAGSSARWTSAAAEYVGASVWLGPVLLDGDEQAIAEVLRLNLEEGTGPTTFALAADEELKALLPYPRLGPLVRRLSLFAEAERG